MGVESGIRKTFLLFNRRCISDKCCNRRYRVCYVPKITAFNVRNGMRNIQQENELANQSGQTRE